jgi:hypothetical protein
MQALHTIFACSAASFLLATCAQGALLRHASSKKSPQSKLHNVAVQARQGTDHQVALSNYNNVQYSGPLTLGGQTLPVVYDTGSFEILVLSTLCTSCAPELAKYDAKQSTTFVSNGVRARHVFGSGPVNSQKAYETVWIGDGNSPYYVANMPFWEVTDHEIAVWDKNAHFSGIVGLCHPPQVPLAFSSDKSKAPDTTLLQATGVDAFSFCLQRFGQNSSGFFSMGPSMKVLAQSGHFAHIPVVGKVHWGVLMTSISAPGLSAANPCNPSCGAIIDSGTSLIAAPPAATQLIEELKSMVKPDCSNVDSLPVLYLTLGGVQIELPPRAYVIKASMLGLRIPMDPTGVWDFIWNGPKTAVVDQCTVAFMTMDKQSQFGPVWILGMPFMRYYYTIFERSTKQIHVAKTGPYCQVPYAGPHVFANTSNAQGFAHHHGLTATDFIPTTVDLKAARLPKWATDGRKDYNI